RRRSVRGHRENVPSPIPGPPLAVELELEPNESAGLTPSVVLLLVRRVPYPRRKGELRPVRRPEGLGHVLIEVGQTTGLATRSWNHVQLLGFALTVGDESERASVGGP